MYVLDARGVCVYGTGRDRLFVCGSCTETETSAREEELKPPSTGDPPVAARGGGRKEHGHGWVQWGQKLKLGLAPGFCAHLASPSPACSQGWEEPRSLDPCYPVITYVVRQVVSRGRSGILFPHNMPPPFIQPSTRLSTFIHPSIHVHLSVHSSTPPSIHGSISPSTGPSICVHPGFHPSVCPSVHPRFHPSIQPSIYPLHLSMHAPISATCAFIPSAVHLSIYPSEPSSTHPS